jgi:hypothetical protein
MRIGIPYWSEGDGVALLHTQILKDLGYEPADFIFDQKIPESMAAIFLYGPWGSMAPMIKQLLSLPAETRPKLIWWLTEQLPNPAWPEWLRYWGGYLRCQMERAAYRAQPDGSWAVRRYFGRMLSSKALRFRYFGDLYWLRRAGIDTLIIQSSPWLNDFFKRRGFTVTAPPHPSYYPEWGADLGLERDIPVLWIGKVATRRRRQLLDRVQAELGKHGVEMLRIDGEQHPYVFGEERTVLLNRTKVVLNLLRAKWDNNAMRFQLAALNRALIVTEPMLNHTLFQPEVHLVEAETGEIPARILYYLSHEEETLEIVERAYQLITQYRREDVMSSAMCWKRR